MFMEKVEVKEDSCGIGRGRERWMWGKRAEWALEEEGNGGPSNDANKKAIWTDADDIVCKSTMTTDNRKGSE